MIMSLKQEKIIFKPRIKRPIPHEYQQEPRILLVTKGTEKIRLIKELVPAECFFKNLIICDLVDYGCPPASRLLGGRRAATETTAALFSTLLAGRFGTFIAPLIPPDTAPSSDEDWES